MQLVRFIPFMWIALAASMPAQDIGSVRASVFKEDFTNARTQLDALPESPERLALNRVLDECELAAACDAAQVLLEDGKKKETLDTLSVVFGRCALAQGSRQRAAGLLAISRGVDSTAFAKYEALLKQLDDKLKDDVEVIAKRKEYVDNIRAGVEKSMDDAYASYMAAHKARAEKRMSTAIAGYETARKLVEDAARSLEAIEPHVDPDDYAGHRKSVETRGNDVRVEAALGLGWIHFELRSYERAAKESEAGLKLKPDHKELIDLRIRAEEFWKGLFDAEGPK